MDIQRVVILVGLAITSYLIILQWNQDYHQKQPSPEEATLSSTPEPVAPTLDSRSVSELPGPEKSATGASQPTAEVPTGSVPVAPSDEVPSVEPAPSAEVAVGAAERREVRVETDVLNIWIDLEGGDITRITLPQFPASLEQPDVPFELLNTLNSYEAQSGLVGPDGPDGSAMGRPEYSSRQERYQMGDGENLDVELVYTDPEGVEYVKRFGFERASYLVTVDVIVTNRSEARWQGNFFAQIKRDSQPPAIVDESGMGLQPYVGGATFTSESPYHKLEFDEVAEELFKNRNVGGYLAMVQHYFVTAWVPNAGDEVVYQARKVSDRDLYLMGFTGPAFTVERGSQGIYGAKYYAGPKHQSRLREIAEGLDLTVDYGFLWWIAQPLFSMLKIIHGWFGNWGVAIILLTVLVKILLYPLSAASFKSMAKMRKLQPEMQRLKERFGDDRQQFSQAMMELYRKEGASPLGGCLPIMLQMPVFLALYWALLESVELRQAPFALWIQDLSVKDPYFVLPILMGASMYLTQLMHPEPPDPVQAKVFKMMPLIFTVFFLWFPSGLVLYWLINNILSIMQQWYVTRQIEAGNVK